MSAKVRDVISLSFLVLASEFPKKVKLKENSLAYVRADENPSDLITGVYGSNSKQAALVMASRWSRLNEDSEGVNRALLLDVDYLIDNYVLTRDQTVEETLILTGWLHFDRIASSYRDELKGIWLDWISKDMSPAAAEMYQKVTFNELALKHPEYIKKMFKKFPFINGIVHPVVSTLDPKQILWAATIRYDKSRLSNASMRFLPQVSVDI